MNRLAVRHLSTCLHPSVMPLINQADKLIKLNLQLQAFLPAEMREQCMVSDFQMGCLTLGVTDGVWLTTLRYELPALRDRLRREPGLHGLTSIKLKVQPFIYELNPTKVVKKKNLSSVAQEALSQLHELVNPS